MNDLIDQIFGDAYITLRCEGGECLLYSQVPGHRPPKPDNTKHVALSAGSVVLLSSAVIWYGGRTGKGGNIGRRRPSLTTLLISDIHARESRRPQQHIWKRGARSGRGYHGGFWGREVNLP